MNKKTIPELMLEILRDGQPHRREDLHKLCGPSSLEVVADHIYRAKKTLPPGHDIVCRTVGRVYYYQWIRLLDSPYDGVT